MKTEFEKMRSAELYYFTDPEILASLIHAKKVCARLQNMSIFDEDYREVIGELIPDIRRVPLFALLSAVTTETALYWERAFS